jgi:DNA-binding SARP family transcriptional activator
MGPVTARAVAWALLGVSAAMAIVGAWLDVVRHPAIAGLDYDVAFFVAFLGFSVVGAIVVARAPRNPVGWLLLAQGLCWELTGVMARYADYALFVSDRSLPVGRFAAWEVNWLYVPALGLLVLMVLVFPDGRLASHRWRPVVWLTVVGIGLDLVATMLAPGPLHEVPSVSNPVGLAGGTESGFDVVRGLGDLALTVAAVASVLSVVFRFRRARGVERQQLRWLAVAGCVVTAAGQASTALHAFGLGALGDNIFLPALLAYPAAVGIAMLRYRLYDVDVVIGKTVVFGGLAVSITAVYLGVVVGIGAAVGRRFGSDVTLAVVATALVAVAFQPARGLLHRTARRLVFGAPTPAEEQAGVAVHCLGAFRLFRDGVLVPPKAWQSKKARSLLKILVSRRGRATTRDFLMETLWPYEDPSAVARRLSVALATVRVVLDPDKRHAPEYFVISDADAVRLDLAHLPVDVERFLDAAAKGLTSLDRGDIASAKAELTAAVDLYAGDFLEEDQYDDWAIPLRDEARTTYVSVVRALAGLAERADAVDDAIRAHSRVLEVDPWNEEAHLGLVRVLEGAGRHGEARRYFQSYSSRMHEIGVAAAPFPSAHHA